MKKQYSLALYISQIDGTPPLEKIKKESLLSTEEINQKIDNLVKNQTDK